MFRLLLISASVLLWCWIPFFAIHATSHSDESRQWIEFFEPSGSVDVTPPWLNISPQDIAIEGKYLYVAGGYNGLHIFDISDPVNPAWLRKIGFHMDGYPEVNMSVNRVAVSNGYAWVIAGAWEPGISMFTIDVDPVDEAHIISEERWLNWSDDLAIENGYLFRTGTGGVWIFDCETPETPEEGCFVEILHSSEHVAVDGNFAYITDFIDNLHIIDFSRPDSAEVIQKLSLPEQSTDIAVVDGYAIVPSYDNNIYIVDIKSPKSAHIVNTLAVDDTPRFIVVVGKYAYVPEWEGKLRIINVENPPDVYIVNTVDILGGIRGIAVRQGYVYVASEAGLQVVDVRDPDYPCIVRTVDTFGSGMMKKSGNRVYSVNSYAGVSIVDVSSPDSPRVISTIDTPGCAMDVTDNSNYAFIADSNAGVSIVKLCPFENPSYVKNIEIPGNAKLIAADECFIYVATYNNVERSRLVIVDVSHPHMAHILGTVEFPGRPRKLLLENNHAYITTNADKLYIIDVYPQHTASIVKTMEINWTDFSDMALSGSHLFITNGQNGFLVIDISKPDEARIVRSIKTEYWPGRITLIDGYAFMMTNYGDDPFIYTTVINIDPPEDAHIVYSGTGIEDYILLGREGEFTFLGENGLKILRTEIQD